ncbi:hypothetical protein BCR43DRAFT_507243 [Syncephalastrum racemosum]|uniref:C2H2-type domain-containing protein n=1 Tax=Syncephalastrum racemosum TaxID=13706 RepID=A0A1X2H6C5_SYNRA|nr:hypothetical protein BCR43DRAFT_507243 [Syncephalastrum racemosum]
MSNYYAHPTQDDDICLSPTNSCESSDDSGPLDPKRRKYQCVICQKYFSRPSALRTHSYTHTGEKPFECDAPGCGRRFAVISNLRRHFKVHRKMPSTTISGGSHAKIPASERLRCVQQLMERTAHRQHERTQHQQPGTHGTASYSNHYHCDPNDAVEKQQQQQRSWMMPPSPPLSAGLSSEEYSASCMESCEEMA